MASAKPCMKSRRFRILWKMANDRRSGVLGMTLAIEPMVNIGSPQVVQLSDRWTVVTKDGSLSAHFEHTVLVTEGEPEIMTWPAKTPLKLKAE